MDYCNIQRCIDSDLFPMTEKQLTLDWAQQTYSNFHFFDKNVTTTSYCSNEDLQQWILKAKSLMRDIKIKGSHAGRTELVRIACNDYNLYLPQKTADFVSVPQKPLNIQEVVAIVSNPQWYYANKSFNQNVIHHLVYGLTRKSNNLWLIDAEREWLNNHQVTYNYANCTRITDSRGFVYKLMNSTFSNTISKMFKRAMVSKLGEYITVRDKDQMILKIDSGERLDLVYEPRSFKHGKGIVISKKDNDTSYLPNTQNIVSEESQMSLWVKQCISLGMEWQQVSTKVKDIFNQEYQCHKTKHSSTTTSMLNNEKQVEMIHPHIDNIVQGMCFIFMVVFIIFL